MVEPPPLPAPRVQVSPLGEAARVPAVRLVRDLRAADIGALLAFVQQAADQAQCQQHQQGDAGQGQCFPSHFHHALPP